MYLTKLFKHFSKLIELFRKTRSFSVLLEAIMADAQILLSKITLFQLDSESSKLEKYKGKKDIIELVEKINEISIDGERFRNLPKIGKELLSGGSLDVLNLKIRIATKYIDFSETLFDTEFEDDEDYMAVHRFVWIFYLVAEKPSLETHEFCWKQIVLWCNKNGKLEKSILKYDVYTVCERVLSWIYLLMMMDKKIDTEERNLVLQSIKEQLLYVVKNLEYHGNNTNNHILNNGRFLYICGSIFDLAKIKKLGERILQCETCYIIKNGISKEGSTHYQMLFTRWFLEVYWAAKASNDREMVDWLNPIVKKMLGVCDELQSNYREKKYPLFGDISPDMDPEWFMGYPFSSNKEKKSLWHQLFNLSIEELTEEDKNSCINSDNQWLRISKNNIEVWVSTKSSNSCHGHNDNGSFELFYKGMPIIVDSGLMNYDLENKICRNQISALGHSIPIINGISPDIGREIWCNGKANSRCEIIGKSAYYIHFKILYSNQKYELNRKLSVINDSLVIEDRVMAKSKHINLIMNWNLIWKMISVRENETSIDLGFENNLKMKIIKTADMRASYKIMENVRSEKYGQRNVINTVQIFFKIPSCEKLITRISFNGVL